MLFEVLLNTIVQSLRNIFYKIESTGEVTTYDIAWTVFAILILENSI